MRILVLAILILGGCGSSHEAAKTDKPASEEKPVEPIVGNDRDEHGCIGSAGYSWCERDKACVRPWEHAAAKGFENNREAFMQYCASTP